MLTLQELVRGDLICVNANVARMIKNWRVDRENNSLSDHFNVYMDIKVGNCGRGKLDLASTEFPRWNYKKIDEDILVAIANVKIWSN